MNSKYKIMKVMNNNVILASDLKTKNEVVLIGKGIGFNMKKDAIAKIPNEKIEKSFYTYDEKIRNDYFQLLNEIDGEIMGICAEIISMAESKLGKLSPRLFVVLTDHISFAIERLKNGIEINNPFLYEIKTLYPEEFSIGETARNMLVEVSKMDITEDEAGFIALHIHAARQDKDVKVAIKYTRIVQTLIREIEHQLDYNIEVGSLTYSRLVNHLYGCITRIINQKSVENSLTDTIKRELASSYKISKTIQSLMEKELEMDVPEDELVYLTIHIDRIKRLKDDMN